MKECLVDTILTTIRVIPIEGRLNCFNCGFVSAKTKQKIHRLLSADAIEYIIHFEYSTLHWTRCHWNNWFRMLNVWPTDWKTAKHWLTVFWSRPKALTINWNRCDRSVFGVLYGSRMWSQQTFMIRCLLFLFYTVQRRFGFVEQFGAWQIQCTDGTQHQCGESTNSRNAFGEYPIAGIVGRLSARLGAHYDQIQRTLTVGIS